MNCVEMKQLMSMIWNKGNLHVNLSFMSFKFMFFFFLHLRFLQSCEAMLQKDIEDNKAIGAHGAQAILSSIQGDSPIRVLTHCNTGSLATAG